MISEAELDAWIARSWDSPPTCSRDSLREMYQDVLEADARSQAKSAVGQRLDRLERENKALRRTVKQIVKSVGEVRQHLAEGGGLEDLLVKALAETRRDISKQTGEKIDRVLKESAVLRDGGVWNEYCVYPKGAVTTHKGTTWVAEETAKPGQRPGDGPPWRMQAKSAEAKVRKIARDVVRDEMYSKEPTAR